MSKRKAADDTLSGDDTSSLKRNRTSTDTRMIYRPPVFKPPVNSMDSVDDWRKQHMIDALTIQPGFKPQTIPLYVIPTGSYFDLDNMPIYRMESEMRFSLYNGVDGTFSVRIPVGRRFEEELPKHRSCYHRVNEVTVNDGSLLDLSRDGCGWLHLRSSKLFNDNNSPIFCTSMSNHPCTQCTWIIFVAMDNYLITDEYFDELITSGTLLLDLVRLIRSYL